MAIYCIDDGGDGSQDNTTQSASTLDWSKADTTIANLLAYDAAALTTGGNIIYFGHSTTQTQASALTIVGPTSGAPVVFISADIGQTTPTYLAATANTIETTGTNSVTFDGSFALYGITVNSYNISLSPDTDEYFYANGCVFSLASGRNIQAGGGSATGTLVNCTIALNDSGASAAEVSEAWTFSAIGLTFTGASTRTGNIFRASSTASGRRIMLSGCDFSGFSNATKCEIFSPNLCSAEWVLNNCKTHTAPVFTNIVSYRPPGKITVYNCGPADAPEQLFIESAEGKIESDTSVYRTGGAEVEGVAVSWKMTATATCSVHLPLYTDWIYGTTTAGAKTFSVAIAHDNEGNGTAGALLNSECWLEVEVMGTADDALSTLHADRPATITTAATDQTADGASSWSGSPGADLQTLSCASVTVGEAGLYRARVGVGLASAGPIYVDPLVTVT